MMSNVKLYWNRLLSKLYRSNYTYPTVSNAFLPEASFGPRVLSIVVACVCVSVCPCVRVCINHLLVRAITRDPFKLGSPNFDQRCKTPWLRSLLFLGAIDLDPQGQIWLKFTPFWACPHDYSSPVQARITKFGPEGQNTLIEIFIVLGAIDRGLQISAFTTIRNT